MKILLQVSVLFASFLCSLFGQHIQSTLQETNISAGAEYSQLLQKMIHTGNAYDFKFNGILAKPTEQNGINVITTIEGINFDEDASNSGFYHIPPDPIGAAGPSHLVSVVNTSIEWFTKAGINEHSESLANFFSSQTPLTGTFDPKVIYDQYNGRFVVVTLEQTAVASGDPSNTSRILIAVSQTSDPNDGWYYTSINSAITITLLCWADYPGLAVTDDAILITCNMFSFATGSFLGSRLWIIQKSPLYSGGVAAVGVYDPSTLAGVSPANFTMQPAHMFGTLPVGVKSYLVASGWSAGNIDYFSVITIGGTSVSPTFSNTFVSHLSDIHNTGVAFPEAPQLGTSTLINTPGNRVMNAVWRNNNLWAVNTVNPPSGVNSGQATAHWYRMATPLTASVSDQGNIGGEDIATGIHTYYPSIAVNSSGDAIIGFSASAPTVYAGAYYTGRYPTTPAGTVLATQTFKPGLDYYIRIFAFNGGTRNRWGDYSGSSVDPSDDETFYIFNEYALTRGTPIGGEDGRWGTAFGVVPTSALPVELSSFTAKVLRSGGIQLDWRTETEVNNYGFDVERTSPYPSPYQGEGGESGRDWEKIAFVEGNGNSNSPREYSYTDLNADYGNYAYRLKQIDTDGQFEYSKIIEVDAGNIPDGFVLEQNYPNPFNPSTTIKFALAETQNAKLIVYDILGNEVATPFNGTADGGKVYEVEFNSHSGEVRNLPSGIYFYRLETKNKVENRKMLLIK